MGVGLRYLIIMRIIGHIDLDAFFASVEERDHEWFRGKPLIVGADPGEGRGRGVVSTANYRARKYGVRSALPISQAWRLCKAAEVRGFDPCVFAAPDFKNYRATSKRIMAIVRGYFSLVEVASIDEAYFDLTLPGSFSEAGRICQELKEEIFAREKLTSSIGVGPNKLIAKIASDFKKPDGLTVVSGNETENFLEPFAVRKIPGVGPKTEQELLKFGIQTVKDLKRFSSGEMRKMFGKWGVDLYEKARGNDDSPLSLAREAKSIGAEETFGADTLNSATILERFKELINEVFRRFKGEGFNSFKTVAIKVRFSDFETKTSAHTLLGPLYSKNTLYFESVKLLIPYLDRRKNPKQKLIRLVGLRIEKLKSG